MKGYQHKGTADMAYDRAKKRLRLEARLVLDELLNEAMAEMTAEFNNALQRGEVLELAGDRDEVIRYLRGAASLQLSAGGES